MKYSGDVMLFQVEVIRARGLVSQPGRRTLPAPYIKVYLVSGKRCIAKAKTSTARRTLDPLYQQTLTFRENFKGCVLQVSFAKCFDVQILATLGAIVKIFPILQYCKIYYNLKIIKLHSFTNAADEM